MIELRDGIVRIHITGRGSNAQSNLEVYGLLDAPDSNMGVHLGSMRSGQFSCEGTVEGCGGRNFQELRGIVLCRKPGETQAIAALWSGEFHAERFTEWKPETKAEMGGEPVRVQREVLVAEQQMPTDIPVQECTKGVTQDSVPQEAAANTYISPTQGTEEEECSKHVEIDALLQTTASDKNVEEIQEAEASSEPEVPAPEETTLQITSLSASLCEEESATCPASPSCTHIDTSPQPHLQSIFWRQLERQYPKMRLQIGGEPIEALRIRPCDICRLPKTDWKYSCNHFLARHYNQYRCLILGRRNAGGSWQCFLGVPGNETFPEEQEAEEAGFGQFLRSDHAAAGWPQGYWITEIPEMN